MTDFCSLVLALEFDPQYGPRSLRLPTEATPLLGEAIALDLLRLAPRADQVGVSMAGALFDAAQILRPDWPVHACLQALYQRDPNTRSINQVMVFGEAGGAMGDVKLEPEAKLVGSPMLYMPISLIGERERIDLIYRELDAKLIETGLASASIALHLSQALSGKIVHAHWFSIHDLCAMIAAQFASIELGEAWQMMEATLFKSKQIEQVQTQQGARLIYQNGKISVQSSFTLEHIEQARPSDKAAFELKQIIALFGAHQMPFSFAS